MKFCTLQRTSEFARKFTAYQYSIAALFKIESVFSITHKFFILNFKYFKYQAFGSVQINL